jgi:hypothetical protein
LFRLLNAGRLRKTIDQSRGYLWSSSPYAKHLV